jgi:cell division protein FtsN
MQRQFQLELFKSKQYQLDSVKSDQYRQGFFGFIKIHEKAISITIALIIISLVSFSLGVEKGKRLTNRMQPKDEQIVLDKNISEKKPEEKKEDILNQYTIQVATFKTKAYAQKEAERLEGKGLEALVVPTGNFVCVCVGNFSEKQKATISLNQLKKSYRDCFIRRL